MLIPLVGCFSIILVRDFPVHILSSTIVPVYILIWGKNSAPQDEVVSSLAVCITESTPSISLIMKNISLETSSEEALILCGNSKLFNLHLSPGSSATDRCLVYLHQLFSFEVGIGSIDSLLSLYLSNSFQLSSIFRILHIFIKFSFKI